MRLDDHLLGIYLDQKCALGKTQDDEGNGTTTTTRGMELINAINKSLS